MANKNKNKGKYFENKIAKLIREAYGLKNHECRRADESGNGKFEYGDIFFTDYEKYPQVYEIKFHEEWTFQGLFPRLNKLFLNWYEELYAAIQKYTFYYMTPPEVNGLIFSKAYHEIYMISDKRYKNISCMTYSQPYDIKYNGSIVTKDLYLYSFEEFLDMGVDFAAKE
jgi:hypothetical protein